MLSNSFIKIKTPTSLHHRSFARLRENIIVPKNVCSWKLLEGMNNKATFRNLPGTVDNNEMSSICLRK